MRFRVLILFCVAGALHAQVAEVLPEITVYSPRVANQAPVATFAMPVSVLKFDPRVDVQERNFAESQADISIRGGIFENTGFRVGAVSLFDPQTGHYFAEIPIAPAMLGSPEILTGADLAMASTNATAGSVVYGWRQIRTAGEASIGTGQFGLTQAEFYQGYVLPQKFAGQIVAADVAWAHSDSNGAVPYGDHVFNRVDARFQLANANSQTDLFAGYQAKFFGWPNLYTPFNSDESEDLQTVLIALNHRREFGGGDFAEFGAYYRRNKDDYAFNRFAPVPLIHPFKHTTWVRGAAASARTTFDEISVNLRAEVLGDELESTSLLYGHFHTRTIAKFSAVPERAWRMSDGATLRLKAGATYDDTNRSGGTISPVFEVAREQQSSPLSRLYFTYSEATQVPTYTALNSKATAGLFRGNPDLGRETSHNVEVGVNSAWAGWTGQAAVFYRRDDDLVDWTYRRGVTARTANAVKTGTTGAEIVAHHAGKIVDLVFGYTYLTKNYDYRGATVDASFYALNYARQRWTAAVTARLSREFELHMDNEYRIQATNLLRTVGGNEPWISSLGLTYRPAVWSRAAITVQADNLWNSAYQEVPAVPAAPRQVSADVRYSW
jgi:vitamin B12 transporter